MSNWQVRQEGTTTPTVVPSANDVLGGVRDGVWLGSDEVLGPGEARWVAIDNHPAFEEVAAELEAPVKVEEDETTLDMNPLIDVCLVLLIFFILTITYETLKRAIDLPQSENEKQGPTQKINPQDVKDRIFRVKLAMDGDNPVVTVEKKVIPIEQVSNEMRDVITRTGRREMLFDVDGNVPWGMQTAVLDAAKGNNVHQIFYMPRKRR